MNAGVPERIGPYRILRKLGAGGMGEVYLAQHTELKVERALKLLPAFADAETRLRFRREAEAMAALDHPHVVRVHELGEVEGRGYLVMGLEQGGDLSARLEQGPLAPVEAAALVRDLADGLAHVHARGVLHRDIKPHNVLLTPAGVPKWTDFGLAALSGAHSLTETGTLMGTPAYMAPEQADGSGEVDAQSDVYGLGAVLYQCLTGQPPFAGGALHELLTRVLSVAPTPVRELNPEVPAGLAAICERALGKAKRARHPSAAALRDALQAWLDGAGVRRSRFTEAAVAASLLVLLAGLGAGAAWGVRSRAAATSRPAHTGSPPPAAAVGSSAPSGGTLASPSAGPRLAGSKTLEHAALGELQALGVAFDELGTLWSVGAGLRLVRWDPNDWSRASSRELNGGQVTGFSAFVLLSGGGGVITHTGGGIWLREGQERQDTHGARSVSVHPDGDRAALAGVEVWVLDLGTGLETQLAPGPGEGFVAALSTFVGDELLVSWFHPKAGIGDRAPLLRYRAEDGEPVVVSQGLSRLRAAVWPEPGRLLVATGGAGLLVELALPLPDPPVWVEPIPWGEREGAGLVRTSIPGVVGDLVAAGPPDGRWVYACSYRKAEGRGWVRGWRWPSGELKATYELSGMPVSLAVDPRGEILAVGSFGGEITLLPLDDGAPRGWGD
jgi:hypothetical protein